MPRALSFALLVALAAFALAGFAPGLLNDGDSYWHIRAGQWMIAHGAVLRADPFSTTAAGAPWHTQEWLAEILMALSWRGNSKVTAIHATSRSLRSPGMIRLGCASRRFNRAMTIT